LLLEINQAIDETKEEKAQVKIMVEVVDSWFQAGLSQYRPCGNWSLFLLTQIPTIGEKYPMGLIDPKEIVKSEFAYCSQNAIVLQEVLRHFGYEYASVRFNSGGGGGHFASAARIKNSWYFLDANIPNLNRGELVTLNNIIGKDSTAEHVVKERYRGHELIPELVLLSNNLGKTTVGNYNEFPAERGLLLQRITKFVSDFAWLVVTALTLLLSIRLNMFSGNEEEERSSKCEL
jgi:hypothetical protein